MEHFLWKESRQSCPSTSAATALLCCCTAAPGAVFLSGSLSRPGCKSRSEQSEKEQRSLFPQTKPCLGSTRTGWSLWCSPPETLSLHSHWHHREYWQELCPAQLPHSTSTLPANSLCCSTAKNSPVQHPGLFPAEHVSYSTRLGDLRKVMKPSSLRPRQ